MCFLFPPSFPKDHEVPDAVVPVVVKNESVLDVDDDPAAADDRTLRKGRLIKGWRMGDAPTPLLRGHQGERDCVPLYQIPWLFLINREACLGSQMFPACPVVHLSLHM